MVDVKQHEPYDSPGMYNIGLYLIQTKGIIMDHNRTSYARTYRKYLLHCVKHNIAVNLKTCAYVKAYLIETSITNKRGK